MMNYSSMGRTQEHSCLDTAADMIDAVARVNRPALVTSQTESVDSRRSEIGEIPLKAAIGNGEDQTSKTSLDRNSADIVDILDRQIRHCTSAGEQQNVRRLMFTFRRKPLPKSSSGVFKSVAAELNTGTSMCNGGPADDQKLPDLLPAIQRSSVLTFDDAVLDSGSCQQQQQNIFNTVERQSTCRQQPEFTDVINSPSSSSSNGGKWLAYDSTPVSREPTVKLTSKQYRSSQICRRALYEKYLDQHEVWAEGLTASGKQTLLDVQRRIRKTAYQHQQQSLWLLPGSRPSRSHTAQPATRADPAAPIIWNRRQVFSASSTASNTLTVK